MRELAFWALGTGRGLEKGTENRFWIDTKGDLLLSNDGFEEISELGLFGLFRLFLCSNLGLSLLGSFSL